MHKQNFMAHNEVHSDFMFIGGSRSPRLLRGIHDLHPEDLSFIHLEQRTKLPTLRKTPGKKDILLGLYSKLVSPLYHFFWTAFANIHSRLDCRIEMVFEGQD
jgi:hypothetical protein